MEVVIYFIIWAALLAFMMRFGCGAHAMGHGTHKKRTALVSTETDDDELRWVPPEADIDPVCQKTVHPDHAKPSVYDGQIYYFCSRECREIFEAAPNTYLAEGSNSQSNQEAKTHA